MRLVPAALAAAAVVAVLVRITFRDRYPLLDLLYYVTPWPVITGLFLVAAGWVAMRRPLRGLALLALGSLTAIPFISARRSSPQRCPATEATLDVVFWNASRGGPSWEGVATELRESGADLIDLVEAGRRQRFDLGESLPGYTLAEAGRGLAVLARGEVVPTSLARFGRLSSTAGFEVRLERGTSLRLFVVDLEAYPLSRRAPLIGRVLDVVESSENPDPARPVIVMGDFNTPHDSVWLEPLASRYPPAFAGYHPTWPLPLPVLMLDQLFRSESLAVRCADVVSTRFSDHARLHVSLGFP